MKTLKYIDQDDIDEKFNFFNLFDDYLCNFMNDLENIYRKYGLPPESDLDEDLDNYSDRTKIFSVVDKHNKLMTKYIKKHLLK